MEDSLTGIATIVLALATVGLAVVTVFLEEIRRIFFRPKLEVSIEPNPPDCLSVPWTGRFLEPDGQTIRVVASDCYYARLRVTNMGNRPAEAPEVFAKQLSKQQADGTFKRVASFLPMNLYWAGIREIIAPAIPPKEMFRHCDIAHILDPEKRKQLPGEHNVWSGIATDRTILSFDVNVPANNLGHLVPFGVYRLDLLISAANVQPIERTLEITLTGDWYSDEASMLSDGLGVRLL